MTKQPRERLEEIRRSVLQRDGIVTVGTISADEVIALVEVAEAALGSCVCGARG